MTFPESTTIISDELSQDLDVVTAVVRDLGLPGIELRSLFGRAFKDLTATDVAQVAARARQEGWRIFGCATPVFKCGLNDRAAIAEHQEHFRRALDVAHRLECDLVRVFTFLRDENRHESGWVERVSDELLQLGELATGAGVRIGVENEYSCLVATAGEMAALLSRLPLPFGAIWDPCNVLFLPDEAAPSPADFTQLASRILHVHVKDAVRNQSTAVVVPIGLGDVGWRSQLATIAGSGYQGLLSLETHWRLEAIDERDLHLPAGYSFSQGGEAASRVCIRNLQALLHLTMTPENS